MTVRRAFLRILANLVLIVVAAAVFIAWLTATRGTEFTGASATGRGATIPLGTLLVVVLGTLIVANLAWAVVTRRR